MKFALNYSPQAAALLEASSIQVDVFKCPDWDDLIEEAKRYLPVYVHFPLNAGENNLEAVGIDKIERLLKETETYYVNTHFSPLIADLKDPNSLDEVVERVLRDVNQLVRYFGVERVILENVPYPESENVKPLLSVDPLAITRVIEASGCGLLLDLGHAFRTAEHLAIDPRRYIEQLPVHQLKEVHVTGLGYEPNSGFRTDHMPMRDDDWALFDWAMGYIRRDDDQAWGEPWAIACEYGGISPIFDWRSDPAVIAAQIPRMYAAVHSDVGAVSRLG